MKVAIGMQLRYPQAHLLISWLTQPFHSARNFPSAALSSALQCNAQQATNELSKLTANEFTSHNSNIVPWKR